MLGFHIYFHTPREATYIFDLRSQAHHHESGRSQHVSSLYIRYSSSGHRRYSSPCGLPNAQLFVANASLADNYSSLNDDSSAYEEIKGEANKMLRESNPSDARTSKQRAVNSLQTHSSRLMGKGSHCTSSPRFYTFISLLGESQDISGVRVASSPCFAVHPPLTKHGLVVFFHLQLTAYIFPSNAHPPTISTVVP